VDLTHALSIAINALPALIVAGMGWFLVHYFTSRRDRKNAERISCTNDLKSAYLKLSSIGMYGITGRSTDGKVISRHKEFQDAIQIVHLLGTEEQVTMANELCRALAAHEVGNFSPLIDSLRDHIRASLGLSKRLETPTYFKLEKLVDERTGKEISVFE
jgi:hypothetical protein